VTTQAPIVEGNTPAERLIHDKRFFGHPVGLMNLFSTEMWERFSYYGMRAILLYFITDTVANHGLGIGDGLGMAIVSVYGTAVYLLSIVGGWVADRMIGAYKSVFVGGCVIALGHVLLALPYAPGSWAGICCVALGTGLLKPNVSSMVGELYEKTDPRRQSAFSIFYMGINVGALLSPLIVGWVRARWGYHAGFSVAAVGMAIALVSFLATRNHLAGAGDYVNNPIELEERPAIIRMVLLVAAGIVALYFIFAIFNGIGIQALVNMMSLVAIITPIAFFVVMYRSPKVTHPEKSRLLAYIPIFVAAMLFFMIFEQAATTLADYANKNTELSFLGMTLTPESFQSVNSIFIILLTPVFAALWLKTKDRPAAPYKFAIGLAFAALSFLFLAAMSGAAGVTATNDAQTGAWVLGLVYVIQTIGELFVSPVGLATTALLAPVAFRSQAMALWFLCSATGQAITAQLVQFTEGMAPTPFFGGIGAVTLVFAGITALLSPWMVKKMRSADEEEALAAPVIPDATEGGIGKITTVIPKVEPRRRNRRNKE
jgi:POT family proton-dependent oligopeptide transporter